ncbi:Hypothetical Protein FCC1311_028082 [Hondaea fermentalgiana]|uniref:Uncharacterized protein n=1 Tax=Hondaea fermentalgiana TaxID=2315210 RepID=A0A2R5G6A4_9STRA|nr:Hypothetical Protein FCC1311_028082 [Hondaea fermentalgiana]|eukprot:GBG26587.1 Hypothetical Protein FCC1311_028082 [Hondaea fermentalgiana]
MFARLRSISFGSAKSETVGPAKSKGKDKDKEPQHGDGSSSSSSSEDDEESGLLSKNARDGADAEDDSDENTSVPQTPTRNVKKQKTNVKNAAKDKNSTSEEGAVVSTDALSTAAGKPPTPGQKSGKKRRSEMSEVPPSDEESDSPEFDDDAVAAENADHGESAEGNTHASDVSDAEEQDPAKEQTKRGRTGRSLGALRKSTPLRLAKKAGKAVGKLGTGKLVRLRGLQATAAAGTSAKNADRTGNDMDRHTEHQSPLSSTAGSSEVLMNRGSKWLFTQRELEALRAMAGETLYDTLVDILGDDHEAADVQNPLLLARLADLIGEGTDCSENLQRALGALRSPERSIRLALLYHLHNLHGHPEGPSADDLRSVLRHTPSLRRAVQALDSLQGENVLDQFDKLIPRLRLESFYLANAPERLTKLDAIESKYRGREETLWKKLEKQYEGQKVPSDADVLAILTVLPTVEALVESAMQGADRLSFAGFAQWLASLEEAGAGSFLEANPKVSKVPSWESVLQAAAEDAPESPQPHRGSDALSSLARSAADANDNDYDGESTAEQEDEDGEGVHDNVSSEEEEEELLSPEPSPPNLEELRTRLEAFYTEQNPTKIATLDFILQKYAGREAQLVQQLEFQYENARVPSFERACQILEDVKREPPYNSPRSSGIEDDDGDSEDDDEEDDEEEDDEDDESGDDGSEIHAVRSPRSQRDTNGDEYSDATSPRGSNRVESDEDELSETSSRHAYEYGDDDDDDDNDAGSHSGVLDDVASSDSDAD